MEIALFVLIVILVITKNNFLFWRSTQAGRRGTPGKGIGR